MGILDEVYRRRPIRGQRGRLRANAEDYAASLGLAPGGPGWGDAIRGYVLDATWDAVSNSANRSGVGGLPNSSTTRLSRTDANRSLASPPLGIPQDANANYSALRGPGRDVHNFAASQSLARLDPATADEINSRFSHSRASSGPAAARRTSASAPPPARDPSPAGRRAAESLLPPADDGPDIEVGRHSWDKPSRKRARDLPSGSLAELRETTKAQGGGVGTVSSGRRDPGGASFGSFQLSANSGNVEAFVKSIHAVSWSADLRGLKPSDPLFKQRWQAIAAREPEAFRRAQQEYLAQARYYPAVDFVWKKTGLDLDRRSDAVREAIWSTSGQHGDAETFLPQAVADADLLSRFAGGPVNRSSPAYDEMLIGTIYDRRIKYVQGLRSRDPRKQRTLQNVIPQLEREREMALDMLYEEQRRPH